MQNWTLVVIIVTIYKRCLLALKRAGQAVKTGSLALRDFMWPAGDETGLCSRQTHVVISWQLMASAMEGVLKMRERCFNRTGDCNNKCLNICSVGRCHGSKLHVGFMQARTEPNGCWQHCFL